MAQVCNKVTANSNCIFYRRMFAMHFMKAHFSLVVSIGIALGAITLLSLDRHTLIAADGPKAIKSGSGTFVSFRDGRLTIKGKAGLVVYENVGEKFQTFQNNENGPGSKRVGTVDALSGANLEGNVKSLRRVIPGTVVRVNVEKSEIHFGLDHRVCGTFVSYRDGQLKLLAAAAPTGFVQERTGDVLLAIDPNIPALESINGGDLKVAGIVGEVLKTVKPGTLLTARSEYDVDIIEVIEIGEPRRRMERYIGQTRGPVRGTFVSFENSILRIHGKGVSYRADNEYVRLIAWRVPDDVPIVESIDGGRYQPSNADALKTLKEGSIVTIRKVEDIILGVQIGVAK